MGRLKYIDEEDDLMAGLHLYTGNRLEILVERLAEVVRTPLPASPTAPEMIVVQSRGMERWVSLELARINGICANCRFPFPNRVLQEISGALMSQVPAAEESPFDPDVMTFRILKQLPKCVSKAGFESLSNYLADDEYRLKSMQLAMRIANLFDQYQVFRPEMIMAWEAGQDGGWQAELWRNVSGGKEPLHRARIQQMVLASMTQLEGSTSLFPSRMSIFGISYLPLFHMQIFAALSGFADIHLFLVNPCKEYWADILPRTAIRKKIMAIPSVESSPEDLHLEEGNRLIANWGKLGRDFFSLIQHLDVELNEYFQEIPDQHLLGKVQSDLLNLVDRSRGSAEGVFESDGSIQVHAAHSPMREMEVLHDQLLAMFDADIDLHPKDIVVMAPDIEIYAPYIHAVLQSQTDERLRIPYTVADRSARQESRLADCLLKLLDLKGSRFGASDVLALLESPPIRSKFGLTTGDMDLIEHWIRAVGIRWGKDALHRKEVGVPGFSENTWKNGLDRMMLGYVMPGEERHLFRDLLPYDDIEGSDVQILGRFLKCMDQLFHFAEELDTPRSVGEWHDFLLSSFDAILFSEYEHPWDIQAIRDALVKLKHDAALAEFNESIEFEPIRHWIAGRMDTPQSSSAFISGGVTFCSMLPMRSIPFKVICLIGMNDDAFPRNHRPLGFDLMAKHPKPGDRSTRKDDKYLFLETLLSARNRLYISYIGQDIHDNSSIPPSVLVSELMDYLIDGYGCTEDQLVVHHPLQAFSPEYFRERSPLFSYSGENLRGASAMSKIQPALAFIHTPLPLSEEEIDTFNHRSVGQFVEFYRNPSKYLLKHRFHVRLDVAEDIPEDLEPFDLDGLTRYRIGSDAIHAALRGTPVEENFRIHKAGGRLPHGSPGEAVLSSIDGAATSFVRMVTDRQTGTALPPLEISHTLSGMSINGLIEDMFTTERLIFRFAKSRAKDLLDCWICHVLLNLMSPTGYPRISTLICKDVTWRFSPIQKPQAILEDLIKWYREGLRRPLSFFPETSYAFARDLIQKGKDRQQALARARRIWVGNDWQRGESADPYIHTCFRHTDPIAEEFADLSGQVFSPLLQHLSETL